MKAKLKRWLSSILVVALLLQMAPFQVFAEESYTAPAVAEETETAMTEQTVTDSEAQDVYIEGEVMEARDEYEKHYRLTDGSFMATQFQVPVHYEEDGEWVDIDNTLQPVAMFDGTEVYQAVNGDYAQAFSATLEDGTVMALAQGDMSISMSLWDGEVAVESEPEAEETPAPETPASEEPMPEETPEEVAEPAAVAANADVTSEPEETEAPALADETPETEAVAAPAIAREAEPEETTAPAVADETEPELPEKPAIEDEAEPEVSALPETIQTETTSFASFNRQSAAQIEGGTSMVATASVDDINEGPELREVTDIVPDTLSSTVVYEDVYPNVDLKYETYSYNVKESIILNAPASEDGGNTPYVYNFLLNLDGLSPALQEDGSILLNNDQGETEYTIPAPYMVDSNGTFSFDVWYTLEQIEEGWLLTVTASETWLEDENRAYPVAIDPTILSKNADSNFRTTASSQNGTPTSMMSYYGLPCGYSVDYGLMKTFIQATTLPSIPEGNTIVGATLKPVLSAHYCGSYVGMKISKLTSAIPDAQWSSYVPWNSQPEADDPQDYITSTYLSSGLYTTPTSWDITKAVKDWYENPSENYGLEISPNPYTTSVNCWITYYSTKFTLSVQYRSIVGTESYYTYETQSVGRAGTGAVGDYSSNLTVAKTDLSYPATTLPYGFSHVYNSCLGNSQLSELDDITAPDYIRMKFGKGWQISALESVQQKTIGSTKYLVYRDGDGTEHYCKTPGVAYLDEDGLGLSIIQNVSGSNVAYTMTDQNNITRYYRNGYLMYIEDGNYNAICFLYNGMEHSYTLSAWYPPATGAQLTKIMFFNRNQEGHTICEFTYDSNDYLTQISDYAGRVTRFSYSNGYLTSITHPDGVVTNYSYNSNGQLTSMYDSESKYGVSYSYDNDGVADIKEFTSATFSGTKTYGAEISRSKNGVQETVITYNGNDRTMDTADDIITRYAFDHSGRTINAVSLNSSETRIYGVTAAAYTESSSSTPASNNKISKSAQSGQAGVNLITAGGLEVHDGMTAPANSWTRLQSAGTGRDATVINKSSDSSAVTRTGSGSIKVYLDSSASASNGMRSMGMYQTVALQGGKTYTFSAYVNTKQVTSFGQGGGVYLAFLNTSNSVLAEGQRVTYSTNPDIEDGWQRVYVTYTPASSGNYRIAAIQENAYTYSYFDDFQLEEGTVPSNVNLLQNGSFDAGTAEWTRGNFSYNTNSDDTSLVHPDVITTTGEYPQTKRASQTVYIGKQLSPGDTPTYLLSGWAKANSASGTYKTLDIAYDEANNYRYYGLLAKCVYSKGGTIYCEYFFMPFNDDYNGWQFASCVVVPNTYMQNQYVTLDYIKIIAAYDQNMNEVAFDGISLRQEPCSTYTYDGYGNITAVNSTGNSTNSYTYADGTAKLTYSSSQAQGNTLYYYNNSTNDHLLTQMTNNSVSTVFSYDTFGNNTGTTVKSDGYPYHPTLQSSATYATDGDQDGSQLTSETNTSGYTTTYTYDSARRQIAVVDNGGTKVETNYYANTDRPKKTYINGVVSTENSYTNGQLSQVKRSGRIPNNSTEQHQTYTMAYDGFGNMTSIAVGNRTLASYQYAGNNGNLQSMAYGNGHNVSYEYDDLGRVTVEKWNGTPKYTYFYNSEGYLSKKLDEGTDKAVNYEYDSLGRLIGSYMTDEFTVNNNPYSAILQRTEHLYDTANRISSQSWMLKDNLSTGNGSYTTYTESYTYRTSDGALSSMTPAVGSKITFTYDVIKRLSGQSNGIYSKTYDYRDISSSRTTTQVETLSYSKVSNSLAALSLTYGYDEVGNIASITGTGRSDLNATYDYDQQGQLTNETNQKGSYTYTYDTYGNIRSVSGAESHSYTYGDTNGWYDLLTKYDNHTINYDAIGNPTNWYNTKAWNFTWQNGRQLASASDGTTSITYTYDVAGIRDSKKVGSTTYNYLTLNGQVVRQTWGSNKLDIIYDNQSRPYALVYNGTTYYYILNLQGDVIRIVDTSGNTVADYVYDAWGKPLNSSSYASSHLYHINPIRYRGYYYDTETGLYYLQSRYYDPAVKRFINSDGQFDSNAAFVGYNLYSYCANNPIIYRDETGGSIVLTCILVGAAIGALAGGVGGAVASKHVTGEVNGWWIVGGVVLGGAAGAAVGWGVGTVVSACSTAAVNAASASLFNGRVVTSATTVIQLLNKFYQKTKLPMDVKQVKQLISVCEQYGIKYYAKLNDLVNVINHKSWDGIPHIHVGESRVHVALTEAAVEYIRKLLGI